LAVKTLLDTMTHALAEGKRIELRGVGSFVLHHRPARAGRNPKTGAAIAIPTKKAIRFKAGKNLKNAVNGIVDTTETETETTETETAVA
jgi:integration host factor subunit beta